MGISECGMNSTQTDKPSNPALHSYDPALHGTQCRAVPPPSRGRSGAAVQSLGIDAKPGMGTLAPDGGGWGIGVVCRE